VEGNSEGFMTRFSEAEASASEDCDVSCEEVEANFPGAVCTAITEIALPILMTSLKAIYAKAFLPPEVDSDNGKQSDPHHYKMHRSKD